ncbi:TetR/AcrR family transcriptional regulator [Amycolatopsis sp. NPDC058340]|uniref:TetR/AcrR family transcriptional regulator n=1 Tax=Amycolatopsis sp. NPDC058340 TaxID=3346453 RepID=UPI00364AEE3F
MGRNSLAEERKAQILSAFARCVARSGFAGTSLESVAEEAKLARGHVRHYLGNRHDQVVALCEWVSTAGRQVFTEVRQVDDDGKRVDAVMDYLFDPRFYEPGEGLAVFLALFEEARRDETLRTMFLESYDDILDTMAGALAGADRTLSKKDANEVAYLMLCAAVGNAHLSQTGVAPSRTRRVGTLARRVLDTLTPGRTVRRSRSSRA